ncbi:hypothetical protein R6Q57_029746 [Mikania cordata]
MSCMNRVWMTAGVAIVNGHTDQGHKLKSGMRSFHQRKKAFRVSVGVDHPDIGSCLDDSIRHVMFMNCWGPS